ncbi:hypothetical protein MIR68_007801 [Amoeboaphelidium protococcarum]|nr:hypothetical protein MIR68_007801 [Amoeboaphelidium protococcarum]
MEHSDISYVGIILYNMINSQDGINSQGRPTVRYLFVQENSDWWFCFTRVDPYNPQSHLPELMHKLRISCGIDEVQVALDSGFHAKLTNDENGKPLSTLYLVGQFKGPPMVSGTWLSLEECCGLLKHETEQQLLSQAHDHILAKWNAGKMQQAYSTMPQQSPVQFSPFEPSVQIRHFNDVNHAYRQNLPAMINTNINPAKLVDNKLYKTKICRTFELEGDCPYGSRCHFAHGQAELRRVSLASAVSDDFDITKQFPTSLNLDSATSDINTLIRSRSVSSPQPPLTSSLRFTEMQKPYNNKFKTRMCDKWLVTGFCPYGSKCTFAHGEQELRLPSPTAPGFVAVERSISSCDAPMQSEEFGKFTDGLSTNALFDSSKSDSFSSGNAANSSANNVRASIWSSSGFSTSVAAPSVIKSPLSMTSGFQPSSKIGKSVGQLQVVVDSLLLSRQSGDDQIISALKPFVQGIPRDEFHSVLIGCILRQSVDGQISIGRSSDPAALFRQAVPIVKALVSPSVLQSFAFMIALNEFIDNYWTLAFTQTHSTSIASILISECQFSQETFIAWYNYVNLQQGKTADGNAQQIGPTSYQEQQAAVVSPQSRNQSKFKSAIKTFVEKLEVQNNSSYQFIQY